MVTYNSIDAAIVGLIKAAIPGLNVWLEGVAPSDTVPPYITYNGNVGTTPKVRGDSVVTQYDRQAQLDFWDTVDGENVATIAVLREAFNNVSFYLLGGIRCKAKLSSINRIPEPMGDNLIHYAATLEITHNSKAA